MDPVDRWTKPEATRLRIPTSLDSSEAMSEVRRRPRVAARSEGSRRQALLRNRVFIEAYRAARKMWLAGMEAFFPRGTYWLCRFARVSVADAITVPAVSN